MKITEDLIRRKAEHHDGLLHELEELTLHQLEIEKIEALGTYCRSLRILYLQNNIIPKIEGLQHLKELRYLNLALNNITKIEGLRYVCLRIFYDFIVLMAPFLARSCEFLNKLDLTVNFIDVDTLEESISHLRPMLHLGEMYMMGNPCMQWEQAREYIVAMLPQLRTMDGQAVTRTERIQAQQNYVRNRNELRKLAAAKREEKGLPKAEEPIDSDDDLTPWTPEARVKMYREMGERKEAEERRRRDMEPKKRDFAGEHEEAVVRVREAERDRDQTIRQVNEGKWDFVLEDEDGEGNCVLRLAVSRFLDTSLMDVDVHPKYVSIVVKSKVFRIFWPDEVRSDRGNCKRSQLTGELVVTVPKVKQNKTFMELVKRRKSEAEKEKAEKKLASSGAAAKKTSVEGATAKLSDLILQETSTNTNNAQDSGDLSDSDVPPLM